MLFVNAPIGIAVMAAAPRAFGETPRQRGRFDLPGAITGTLGLAALVYGLSSAATTANGAFHWGDAKVVASLSTAVALLACFVLAEARSPQALMPLRIFANRDRTGANLVRLCVGTTMFGLFFFLTLFMQAVWGYSALKTGLAYLPMSAAILATSGPAPPWYRESGPVRCCWPARPSPPAACSGCRGSPSTAPTPAACSARPSSLARAWACCSCP